MVPEHFYARVAPASSTSLTKQSTVYRQSGLRPDIGPLIQQTVRRIHIHHIDNFIPDIGDNFFNHGETTARKLAAGGGEPTLAGRMTIYRYNVGYPADQSLTRIDEWAGRIVQVLDTIIQKSQEDGNRVDAVSIPLQNFDETPHTGAVRSRIGELIGLGIPVAVAAGNEGSEAPNMLANPDAFIVQATENGVLRTESGPGNVKAEGGSTSFSVVAVAPLLGKYKSEGKGIACIRQNIQEEMDRFGGSIPIAPGSAVYGDFPCELRPLGEVAV